MLFDFDLKYSFLPVPSAGNGDKADLKSVSTIIFEKGDKKVSYVLRSMSDLQHWR